MVNNNYMYFLYSIVLYCIILGLNKIIMLFLYFHVFYMANQQVRMLTFLYHYTALSLHYIMYATI